jgi:hypothetical protein
VPLDSTGRGENKVVSRVPPIPLSPARNVESRDDPESKRERLGVRVNGTMSIFCSHSNTLFIARSVIVDSSRYASTIGFSE